jgi:hypothetical protein
MLWYVFAVVLLGELVGASGFSDQANLFAKYRVVTRSDNWRVLHGEEAGQSWIADRLVVRGCDAVIVLVAFLVVTITFSFIVLNANVSRFHDHHC